MLCQKALPVNKGALLSLIRLFCKWRVGLVQQPSCLFKAPLQLCWRFCCHGNKHRGKYTREAASISRVPVCEDQPEAADKWDWEVAWGYTSWKRIHAAIIRDRVWVWIYDMLTEVGRNNLSGARMHTHTSMWGRYHCISCLWRLLFSCGLDK